MKKVCLITPPSPFLMDERVFCSLGILKIGTVLEDAGYAVDHIDLSGVPDYVAALERYDGARTFCITATSPQMPAAVKIAQALRKRGLKTILGGPHATLTVAASKLPNGRNNVDSLTAIFDVVVAGDGEESIFQALSMDRGLIDADDPKSSLWISSKKFEERWPARHLLDLGTYNYSIDGRRALSIISQLGCPFGCTFCGGRNSAMLRRIRTRSPESVIDEMLFLHETYGITGLMFYDDELNVNKQLIPLLKLIKETGIDWRLRGFLKAELFNDEQAEAMYAAGFRQILIGFEAADERILENIQKRATVADNTKAVEIAHRNGLKVKALMSVGHAGETKHSILKIRDWLCHVEPSDFDVTVITPYPGSPYYDSAVQCSFANYWVYTAKNGDRLFMDEVDFLSEAQYYKGAPGSYVSHVWTDFLNRESIVGLRDQVESEVRKALSIPAYTCGSQFEASMGQTKLPPWILHEASQEVCA